MIEDTAVKAGRELDALVAEKVMGWECVHKIEFVPVEVLAERIATAWLEEYKTECPPEYALAQAEGDIEWNDYPPKWCVKCHAGVNQPGSGQWNLPKFSEDISAAWEVVEKMLSNGYSPALVHDDAGHWALSFDAIQELGAKTPYLTVIVDDEVLWVDTAPHAICLAALKSAGVFA